MKISRKIWYVLVFALVLSGLTVSSVFAHTPGGLTVMQQTGIPQTTPAAPVNPPPTATPALEALAYASSDIIPLSQLGFTETRLVGPYDAVTLSMGLPMDWTLDQAGLLELHYYLVATREGVVLGENYVSGQLDVNFNGVNIKTILLNSAGEHIERITIPVEAYTQLNNDGTHELNFNFLSDESCTYDYDVNVVIRQSSYLAIPHKIAPPTLDLSLLPRPIYMPNEIKPSTAVLVVPDNPSASEIRSALEVAAGFGKMTGGALSLTLMKVSQLNQDIGAANHFIFVGKPGGFPALKNVALPLPIGDKGFDLSKTDPNDGVLQMAMSPWSSNHVVLLVSGNSDEAVVKAGHAIYVGTILTTAAPSYTLVQDINIGGSPALTSIDRTFADLGYDNWSVSRSARYVALSYYNIEFYVPVGQQIGLDSNVEIHFNNSAMLDYERSGISLSLNGRLIGSVRFSDESTSWKSVTISLPRSATIPGKNQLQFQIALAAKDTCADYANFQGLWTTIYSDSFIHVPLEPATGTISRPLELGNYPDLLIYNPQLGNLNFILPEDDSNAWQVAARVAFYLGDQLTDALAQMSVMFANKVDETQLKGRDVVIIGKPSSIPLITQWNDVLPAPFEKGTDVAVDKASRVVYRIPAEASVGYLELFSSPVDDQQIVLALLGNNENGLIKAGDMMTKANNRGNLGGNFSYIYGDQVISVDTRLPVAVTSQNPANDQTTTGAKPQAANQILPQGNGPSWVLIIVGLSTLIMVAILVFVVYSSIRKRK